MAAAMWGIILTIAALVAIGLHSRRWRRHRIGTLQFIAGMIARLGFAGLGIIYAANIVERWPRAPIYGLFIVGIGIVLNLVAGIVDSIRRAG